MPDEPAYAVLHLQAYLEGHWHLDRSISDLRGGKNAHFEGEGRFEPTDAGLCYTETGALILEGSIFAASRSYAFLFPKKTLAEVRFDDGRLFHSLDLSTGSWTDRHLCPPDTYDGVFSVQSAGAWTSRWRVTGPRKDQEIETLFQRA